MPDDERDAAGAIEWLKVLIATLLLAVLVGAYAYLAEQDPGTWRGLALSMIPSISVVLLVYIAIYFALGRKGIGDIDRRLPWSPDASLTDETLSTSIAEKVSGRLLQRTALQDQELLPSIRQVPWQLLIEESQQNITVAVYFCDTWISQHYESFLKFAGKPNTTMKLFLANIVDDDILAHILLTFPSYSKEALEAKVKLSKEGVHNVFSEVGASPGRVSANYYPRLMQYSMILFDNKRLVVWFVDMNRGNTMNSPALILDLEKSEALRNYFMNELDGIRERSIPLP